jgi:hypothetical protein
LQPHISSAECYFSRILNFCPEFNLNPVSKNLISKSKTTTVVLNLFQAVTPLHFKFLFITHNKQTYLSLKKLHWKLFGSFVYQGHLDFNNQVITLCRFHLLWCYSKFSLIIIETVAVGSFLKNFWRHIKEFWWHTNVLRHPVWETLI